MLSIGIDVSKGKSTVCGMKPGGEIVYTPFEVQHTREGMSELVSLLRSSGEEVRAVLESTGSYHCPVVAALLENGIFVSVVNSLRRYHHTTHILEMGEARFRKDYCKWAEKRDTAIANVWQRSSLPQLKTVSLCFPMHHPRRSSLRKRYESSTQWRRPVTLF